MPGGSKDPLLLYAEILRKEASSVTEKQRRFCDEYLIDLNATRAYKAAYPNVKKDGTAAAAAARLLRNVKVQEYLRGQMEKIHNDRTADQQEVLEYLTSVLRGESKAEVVVVEGTGEGCSEARRVLKHPDEKERLKAAELLGKRYGLWTPSEEQRLRLDKMKAEIERLRAGQDSTDDDQVLQFIEGMKHDKPDT